MGEVTGKGLRMTCLFPLDFSSRTITRQDCLERIEVGLSRGLESQVTLLARVGQRGAAETTGIGGGLRHRDKSYA